MNLQKINYQKELEKVLDTLRKEGKIPTLLQIGRASCRERV